MKYEIIFYHSGKTAQIEKTVNSELESSELELSLSSAAVTPEELAEELKKSLKRTDLVFVVGGLDGGEQSTDNVLSIILSSNGSEVRSEKLVDDEKNTSYLLKCKNQTIVVFPDDIEFIEKMLRAKIILELRKKYSLKYEEGERPQMDKITKELDSQLSGMNRVRTSIGISNDSPPRNTEGNKILKRMKTAVIILLALGCIQIVAAGILFFTNLPSA